MSELVLAAILIGFAAFRGWRILAQDSISEPIRARMIARDDWVWDLFSCPWCIGFWYAGIGAFSCGFVYDWNALEVILVWLASSGLAGLLGAEGTGKHL